MEQRKEVGLRVGKGLVWWDETILSEGLLSLVWMVKVPFLLFIQPPLEAKRKKRTLFKNLVDEEGDGVKE